MRLPLTRGRRRAAGAADRSGGSTAAYPQFLHTGPPPGRRRTLSGVSCKRGARSLAPSSSDAGTERRLAFDVLPQAVAQLRLAQLRQRLGLDLAHSLPTDAEFLADLPKRPIPPV